MCNGCDNWLPAYGIIYILVLDESRGIFWLWTMMNLLSNLNFNKRKRIIYFLYFYTIDNRKETQTSNSIIFGCTIYSTWRNVKDNATSCCNCGMEPKTLSWWGGYSRLIGITLNWTRVMIHGWDYNSKPMLV